MFLLIKYLLHLESLKHLPVPVWCNLFTKKCWIMCCTPKRGQVNNVLFLHTKATWHHAQRRSCPAATRSSFIFSLVLLLCLLNIFSCCPERLMTTPPPIERSTCSFGGSTSSNGELLPMWSRRRKSVLAWDVRQGSSLSNVIYCVCLKLLILLQCFAFRTTKRR